MDQKFNSFTECGSQVDTQQNELQLSKPQQIEVKRYIVLRVQRDE